MRREQTLELGIIFVTVACLISVGCGGGEEPSIRDSEITAKVAALFEDWSVGDSPGAAVMVIEDGEILFEGGFGLADIESETPITSQSAFRLASVSKQFTAMAIMILTERGQLDIDDKLTQYIPELARFGDDISIRHLLTHTGGLPDYYDVLEEEVGDSMPDTETAMEFLAGWGEPLFPAGDRFEYSTRATRCWPSSSSASRDRRLGSSSRRTSSNHSECSRRLCATARSPRSQTGSTATPEKTKPLSSTTKIS